MHTTNKAIRLLDLLEAIREFLVNNPNTCLVVDDMGRSMQFPEGMCLHCADGDFRWQQPYLFWRLFFDLLKSHGVDVEKAKYALKKSIEENRSQNPCEPYSSMKILRIIAEHLH